MTPVSVLLYSVHIHDMAKCTSNRKHSLRLKVGGIYLGFEGNSGVKSKKTRVKQQGKMY